MLSGDLEPDVAITEVLARSAPTRRSGAPSRVLGQVSDLCHVLVVATQFLPDCRLVLWRA